MTPTLWRPFVLASLECAAPFHDAMGLRLKDRAALIAVLRDAVRHALDTCADPYDAGDAIETKLTEIAAPRHTADALALAAWSRETYCSLMSDQPEWSYWGMCLDRWTEGHYSRRPDPRIAGAIDQAATRYGKERRSPLVQQQLVLIGPIHPWDRTVFEHFHWVERDIDPLQDILSTTRIADAQRTLRALAPFWEPSTGQALGEAAAAELQEIGIDPPDLWPLPAAAARS